MKFGEIERVSDVCRHLDWITSSRREESCGINLEAFRESLPHSVIVEMGDSRLAVRAVGLMKAKAFFRGLQGSKHAVNPTGLSDKKPMKAWLATGGEGAACLVAMETFWKMGLKEATAGKRVYALKQSLRDYFTLGKQLAPSVEEEEAAELAAYRAMEAKQAASRREALKKQLIELLLEQPDLVRESLEEAGYDSLTCC